MTTYTLRRIERTAYQVIDQDGRLAGTIYGTTEYGRTAETFSGQSLGEASKVSRETMVGALLRAARLERIAAETRTIEVTEAPPKVQSIHRILSAGSWDRVEIEEREAYGTIYWSVRAYANEGTLADARFSTMVAGTRRGGRLLASRYDSLGSHFKRDGWAGVRILGRMR